MDTRSLHDTIAKTALLLNDGDNTFLSTFGLNYTQYRVLEILSPQHGQRLVDLATVLLCDRSTITRIIDRLEQMDVVQRQADAEDRRSQRVVLTQTGIDLREKVKVLYEQSLQQRLDVLSEKDQLQLVELLKKLQKSLVADLSKP